MDAYTKFGLVVNEAAQHRRSADLLIREAAREVDLANAKAAASRGGRFSIVRAVEAAAASGVLDGVEREIGEELARRAGESFDRHRPWVPWSALVGARTLQVGTSAAGGYLVGNPTTQAVEALFPYSTVVRLGAQVFDGLTANANIPRVSANGTAYWTGELGTATSSDLTLGVHAGKPYQVGAYGELSRSMLATEPVKADRLIGGHLLGLVGAKIDAAAIAGTGTTSPTGITKTAGLGALTTGTSFDWSAALAMVKTVTANAAIDENVRALAAPAVRELLAKRPVVGTGAAPFVWDAGRLAGAPGAVNANVPASTLVVGDFSTVYLLLWGEGLQVEVNPYAQFASGFVGYRVLAGVDVAVTQPGAFAVSTGIT